MNEEELQRELERLQAAGLNPMVCDMPVPYVDVPVLAGHPAETGDATNGEYVMLPRQLVGRHPVFLIDAEGLSMQSAGIMPGDRLEVDIGAQVGDGDTVVAEVDGAYTVKTLFTDDEGLMWLVPQNDSFDPIALEGRLWRIIGKVTGLRKGMPRASYGDCAKAVMRVRAKRPTPCDTATDVADQPRNLVFKQFYKRQRIDFAAVRQRIERVVVMQLKHQYEWYAAYRILMDLGLLDELKLTKFAQQMCEWFPDVAIRCTADALSVYAVGHTSKAFTLWNSEQFRQEKRRDQSAYGFNVLYHRCEELRAALFPLPTIELGLPF